MFEQTVPENFTPDLFYKVFVFKTIDIQESEVLLDALNFDLSKRMDSDYRNSIIKKYPEQCLHARIILNGTVSVIYKTIVNDNGSVTNFIFITEDDILKAAICSGITQSNLYTRSINYTNPLSNEFRREFKVESPKPQMSLI